MMRFNQTAGSTKSNCYLDDVKLYYQNLWPEPITGDVNSDGEVSIADVNELIGLILSGSMGPSKIFRADVNGDGEVNIADVNMIIALLLAPD